MFVGELLTRNARRQPDKVALTYGAKHNTFGELNSHVDNLVQGFHRLGMKSGDRLAILADNCPEYVETLFAAAKAGLVAIPINTRLREEDIAFILQDSEARALILTEGYWELIKSIRHQLTVIHHFITIGNGPGESYEGLATSPSSPEFSALLKEDDLYCIAYTGGTTGLPKGAMLSHRNILAAVTDGVADFGFNLNDVGLVCHPLFHVSALWTMFTQFYMGSRCILMKQFEPHALLETVEREKVTNLGLASPLVIALLHEPDISKFNLSSLRVLLYAGTPLPAEMLKRAIMVFGKVLYGCYALTEAVTCVTILRPEDQVMEGPPELTRRLSSCGRESLNTEVRVVDEDGQKVAPDQVGEITIRGDSIMKGYWKQPVRTAETLKNGFLYTGDLATIDKSGFIYTFDRKVDTINSGGQRVSSKEVEETIYRHPAVQEVAVVGVPDIKLGEAIQAVIVLKEGKTASTADILQICRQNLPAYALPHSVDFVDRLPRNAIGKILKRTLREKYGGQRRGT